MLIAAAIISIILGSIPATSEDPSKGWIDGVAILFAVVIVVSVSANNENCHTPSFNIKAQ